MSKPSVLILRGTDGVLEHRLLDDAASVKILPKVVQLTDVQMAEEDCRRVVALEVDHLPRVDRAMLQRFPNLRAVVRTGIGVDNIDKEAATELGVCICNVPDYGIEEVADTTLAHILALFRQTVRLSDIVKRGECDFMLMDHYLEHGSASRRIRGKVLGLLGMGNIGLAVTQRAKAFGFKVIVHDPYLPVGIGKAVGDVSRVDTVEELIRQSDCISLHAPLTPETKNIINEERLALFKKEAFLVNTSRGGLVDEEALVRALREGRLAGAALDVQASEPVHYKTSVFNGVPNLILTPHSAWYSQESYMDLITDALSSVRYAITHSDPSGIKNCINKQVLKTENCQKRWRLSNS